jgi:hypothetical protein
MTVYMYKRYTQRVRIVRHHHRILERMEREHRRFLGLVVQDGNLRVRFGVERGIVQLA